ncbi:hypothetical protein SPRG_11153 [Saprolegnia parasitica CBS 223.65]|uniref:Coronin n=1 Tax=Saprolegnia parasitica (strain CBS 223.65) TaxID=695850 RepID=A0A067C9M5_SAPPC|nr:hypothetical protein SPRG_11153 [Saprolegnia parasitica CBS 223.65]KDO23221.1 hypothetical protein SPRG_11153 [Saprolegnia parasitica CBS 223.65]|eukprot:XP_012206019.1 hypothetical protein SPRG_11153 [Saprolegnia parasitica CBS 223.65]
MGHFGMFKASKYRNLLGTTAPRAEWYEELQLDAGRLDLYPLTASTTTLAFASQYNAGAVIEVKELGHVGKANAQSAPVRLLRGHTQRVNAIAFSPFHASLLASGGDDGLLKLWHLAEDTCAWTSDSFNEKILSIAFHPSAKDVLHVATSTGLHLMYLDTSTSTAIGVHPNTITGTTWNDDGSLVLSVCQDNMVRGWDPRTAHEALAAPMHQGRKAASIAFAYDTYCVTAGFSKLQERELFLWDWRSMTKPIGRERVDTSTGVLAPMVDPDTKLLFLGGRGDRSVKAYEIQPKHPIFAPLQTTAVATSTWGLTRLPKHACDTSVCEVARVLSLGAGTIEPILYTVPRKEAASVFQADLYPDTRGPTPALSAAQWRDGTTAPPLLEPVRPTLLASVMSAPAAATTTSAVSGWSTGHGAPPAAAGSAPAPTASVSAAPSGWDNMPMRRLEPETSTRTQGTATPTPTTETTPVAPTPTTKTPTPSAGTPTQWAPPVTASAPAPPPAASAWKSATGWGHVPETVILSTPAPPPSTTTELSEKAKRLGALQGHKLKYLTGRPDARSESFLNVAGDGNALATNGVVWAASVPGTGGSIHVHPLDRKGKVTAPRVLQQHKASVTDLAFAPFASHVLASASDDATINLWDTTRDACVGTLVGHEKGVRCLSFHPTAANVLASGALDATVRLWDVETGVVHQTIDKFDEAPFNVSFNADGSLFATITRDKVLRVIDPRLNQTVGMACAHAGSKAQRVTWCTQQASSLLFTVGFSARSERQICLWDARNLLDPVVTTTIDTSGSALLPLYDSSSHVMYLVGRGDRTVLCYEIDTVQPALLPCSIYSFNGPSISAATFLPKQHCNVQDVEVSRMLLLTSGATIEPVAFVLPRAEKLRAYFQDDVYGPVPSNEASVSAADWFLGAPAPPKYTSLQPAGMLKLSEKPPEAVVIPKVVNFQAQKERELQEQRDRDAKFERLHSLAYQPSLHANATQRTTDADSDDDGWDD